MRNTGERVAAAFRGADRIKKQREKRYLQAGIATTLVCSFCMLISLVYFVPSIVVQGIEVAEYTGLSGSIFSDAVGLGYIIIGVMAFLLGICATILCVLLRNRMRQMGEDENDT